MEDDFRYSAATPSVEDITGDRLIVRQECVEWRSDWKYIRAMRYDRDLLIFHDCLASLDTLASNPPTAVRDVLIFNDDRRSASGS